MNANPFYPFAQLDPSSFDLSKMIAAAKVPGVDAQALLEAHKKNIEALAQANAIAVEGIQALAKRQMEIMTQTMTEASKAYSNLQAATTPGDKTQVLTDVTKQAFEQALENMRALADTVSQSNRTAMEVISKRVTDGLDEIRDLAKKSG